MTQRESVQVGDLRLSTAQAGMLLFFGGRRAQPCANRPTTLALAARGLLARDEQTSCFELTDRGREVFEQLDVEDATGESTDDVGPAHSTSV